jgi:ADP-ribose pyrophosphatase YjhB (NUDIX family)
MFGVRGARKRVGADAILRDDQGRILLVDPDYKPDWDLPGAMIEANEPPIAGLIRELKEEPGLELRSGQLTLACIDWVAPPLGRLFDVHLRWWTARP